VGKSLIIEPRLGARRKLLAAAGALLPGFVVLAAATPAWARRVPQYVIEDDKRARGIVQAPVQAGFDLPEREGVLSWKVLGNVGHDLHLPPPGSKHKYLVAPRYPQELARLNGKRVRMQGFIAPFKPGQTHTEFLLSARTTDCNFCVAGGPESYAHVLAREAVKPVETVVVLEGTLELLSKDESGMFYRLTDARIVS
jgi:uncharacterized protein